MTPKSTCYRTLLGGAVAVFALLFLGPGVAMAERVVNSADPIVVSDDITNRTIAVQSLDDGAGNHGHGNNEDGVDSSNPGGGDGGPNGSVDASCDGDGACVDDESSGGGSAMSNNKK
jgi:hypothetical protein